MPREPLKDQILETVAHLVDENRVRAEAQDELDEVEAEIKRLKELIDDQKVIQCDRREAVKDSESRCLALIDELGMLTDGKPRLPNIAPTLAGDSVDPADHHQIKELCRFGLTEKQIDKLADSKLAAEFSIKSVGDLLRIIEKNSWWHRKVKGWGETAVDKATDALTAYRSKHPAPDGDDRPKKCLTCHEVYAQIKAECPKCGSTTFELIDKPSDPKLTQRTLLEPKDSKELAGANA